MTRPSALKFSQPASLCRGLFALTAGLMCTPVHAYLGPGAGLGMIGSLIAAAVVGIVVVLGLFVYPIRMMRKRRRDAASGE